MGDCGMRDCDRPATARGLCDRHYKRWRRYGDPEGAAGLLALAHRFWSKVEKTDTCWNWVGTVNNRGRPLMSVGPRSPSGAMKLGSHVGWYLEYGVWPEQLNHTCDNPLCVRHDHVYEGGQMQNMRDMADRRPCPKGHPRTPEHLQVRRDGTRYCKTCQNEKRRVRGHERE